jgi:hypothetical protein
MSDITKLRADLRLKLDMNLLVGLSDAEVRALLDALDAAEATLRDGVSWFQAYADGHEAKGDRDKATRNRLRELAMRNALTEMGALP